MRHVTLSHETWNALQAEVREMRTEIAAVYSIDGVLLEAIMEQESGQYPYALRVENGLLRQGWFLRACRQWGLDADDWRMRTSIGLMQILTVNCYAQGFRGSWEVLFGDYRLSLDYACRHWMGLLRRYALEDALSAYNAGSPTSANRRSYVAPILTRYRHLLEAH
jgi:soluble lytic murein transglycosylase-like protein